MRIRWEVIRWTTEYSRLQDPGIRAFLSLADALPRQLKEPPGQEERQLLIGGWRVALRDLDHQETVRRGGKAWLEAAAQDQALRETVLTILADACQSSRDIGTLYAIAMQWSRDKAARHRLAVAYVRQSSRQQVLDHGEPARLQYGPSEPAVALGWAASRVMVLDPSSGSRTP